LRATRTDPEMNEGKKSRILIAKPGLDGHDRGAKIVARALSNAGLEVIYTGLHQTPLQIVNTAMDEDVDAIGLSVLSGAHNTIFSKVMALLKERNMEDIVVFGGGSIPQKDWPNLHAMGVSKIFPPGSDTRQIVEYVQGAVKK